MQTTYPMPSPIRYPWDTWFARGRFRLVRGRHFSCAVHGMAQQVRTAACKRGLRARIDIAETTIIVQIEKGTQ